MTRYFTAEGMKNYQMRIDKLESSLSSLESRVQDVCETGGDVWHDNASYDYLTNDIRMTDKRLNDAMRLLRDTKIITYATHFDQVLLGSRVGIDLDGVEENYDIVAYGEEDSDNNKILYESPLAKSLMFHKIGDEFEFSFGDKKQKIKILDIVPITA